MNRIINVIGNFCLLKLRIENLQVRQVMGGAGYNITRGLHSHGVKTAGIAYLGESLQEELIKSFCGDLTITSTHRPAQCFMYDYTRSDGEPLITTEVNDALAWTNCNPSKIVGAAKGASWAHFSCRKPIPVELIVESARLMDCKRSFDFVATSVSHYINSILQILQPSDWLFFSIHEWVLVRDCLPIKICNICITHGEDGVTLLPAHARSIRARCGGLVPVDTSGAGDAFISGFISKAVNDASFATCVKAGMHSGAFATQMWGMEEFTKSKFEDWRLECPLRDLIIVTM